jgi:hypothetical protein
MTISLKDFAEAVLNHHQPLQLKDAFLEAYLGALTRSSALGTPSLVDPDVVKLVVKTANETPALTRSFDIIDVVAERHPEMIDRPMAEAVDKAGGTWMSANAAYGTVKGKRPDLFPPDADEFNDCADLCLATTPATTRRRPPAAGAKPSG